MKHALLLAAVALVVATVALADNDNDPATQDIPHVVPYDGVLDLDGTAFNGPVDVIFTLYDSAEGGEAVWSETWSTAEDRPLNVTAGRFAVNLGTYEELDAVIADAGQVYLGLSVKRPDEDAWTELRGRQRVNPVPYALWSTRASNLSVAGVAAVGGDLTVGTTTHTQDLVVDDQIIANRIFLEGANDVAGRLFSHFGGWLYLGEADTFENGLRVQIPMRADDDVRINADLTVNGAVTVPVGAFGSREIADDSVVMDDLADGVVGDGLEVDGGSIAVDDDYLDARIRSWVRSHCSVRLGWRDNCDDCTNAPEKHVTVRADGVCTGSSGTDTACRNGNNWGGVNTDGDVNGDDVFYIRLICN